MPEFTGPKPGDPDYDPALRFFEVTVEKEDGKLGFRYVNTEVVHVTPDSWAQKQGIEVDDEIMLINSTEVSGLTEKEKLDLFTGERPFTIKFKRPKYKDTYYELECNEAKLGFKYNKLTITSVVPDGWAERNGIVRGDQLIEVNRQLFELLDEQKIFDLLRGPRPLTMQFKRPAKVHIDQAALEEAEKKPELNRVPAMIMEKGPNYVLDENGVKELEKELAVATAEAHPNNGIEIEEENQGGLFGSCCSCKNVANNSSKVKVIA